MNHYETDPFYLGKRWKRLRLAILRRDDYQCQVSKRYGRIVQATMVHHIFPRAEFPQYEYEPWNLIALSAAAHGRLHDGESGKLTHEGMDLLRRTAKAKGKPIPPGYE